MKINWIILWMVWSVVALLFYTILSIICPPFEVVTILSLIIGAFGFGRVCIKYGKGRDDEK